MKRLILLLPLLLSPSRSQPIIFGSSRFTLLSPSLWRLERALITASPPAFDDRPTLAITRRLPLPPHNVSYPANKTVVICSLVSCLRFLEDGAPSFSPSNLAIATLINGAQGGLLRWTPGSVQRANLNGTYVSLDCYADPLTCYQCYTHDPACTGWEFGMEGGLLSRDGWNVYEDTQSLRVSPGVGPFPRWSNATIVAQDLYFHAFGTAFKAALSEFAEVSGKPGLVPRAALGVMFSRYYPYSAESFTTEVLEGFAAHEVPLHAVYFDMDVSVCALVA